MKRLLPLAYSAVFFLVLLLGWYFGSRTTTVHAQSTTVTYFGTSAKGCTAEPNSTCTGNACLARYWDSSILSLPSKLWLLHF